MTATAIPRKEPCSSCDSSLPCHRGQRVCPKQEVTAAFEQTLTFYRADETWPVESGLYLVQTIGGEWGVALFTLRGWDSTWTHNGLGWKARDSRLQFWGPLPSSKPRTASLKNFEEEVDPVTGEVLYVSSSG